MAIFTLFSCVFAVSSDTVMWFLVDGYNPIAQTISELAAGPHRWLQDLGIIVFVVGTLAMALSLFLREGLGISGWILQGVIVLLAFDLSLIALWNEYGDSQPGGWVIHSYLVWLLYALVPLLLWFCASVTPVQGGVLTRFGKTAAIAWLVVAPIFKALSTGVDGAYERVLAMIMIGTIADVAWQTYRETKEGRRVKG